MVRRAARSGSRIESYGYPSAHSAVAAALVTVASPYLPRAWRWVAWTAVFATGFARLYVGAHFTVDVLGGIALGWSIGSLVNFLIGTPGVISRSTSTVGLTAAQSGNS